MILYAAMGQRQARGDEPLLTVNDKKIDSHHLIIFIVVVVFPGVEKAPLKIYITKFIQ